MACSEARSAGRIRSGSPYIEIASTRAMSPAERSSSSAGFTASSSASHLSSQTAALEDKWLAELDAVKPADDEERSAGDIARVEAISIYGDPERILPALRASEQAMPQNYNASLRVAQMEKAAQHYDATIAACDLGLSRNPGAQGRSSLLQ